MINFDDVTKENIKKHVMPMIFIKILKNTIQINNTKY